MEAKELPQYEAPQVATYTEEEILDELGPAWTFGPLVASPFGP